MNNLGAFGKPCQLHPGRYISDICSSNTCEKRILCVDCRKSHPTSHSSYLEPLLDFLSLDLDDETYKGKAMLKECEGYMEFLLGELDKALQRIRAEFDVMLVQFKDEIIHHLQGKDTPNYRVCDNLKKELLYLREQCFDTPGQLTDRLLIFRDQFIEGCLDLKRKNLEIQRHKDSLQKALMISEKDLDGVMEKLKNNLANFKYQIIRTQPGPAIITMASPSRLNHSFMSSYWGQLTKDDSFTRLSTVKTQGSEKEDHRPTISVNLNSSAQKSTPSTSAVTTPSNKKIPPKLTLMTPDSERRKRSESLSTKQPPVKGFNPMLIIPSEIVGKVSNVHKRQNSVISSGKKQLY